MDPITKARFDGRRRAALVVSSFDSLVGLARELHWPTFGGSDFRGYIRYWVTHPFTDSLRDYLEYRSAGAFRRICGVPKS